MRKLVLVAALGAALTSPAALAITSDEVNAGIQFNFANPGARALGMGGAFLGLADDATAAYTNPAGLTILGAPEVAWEYRYTGYETPFTSGGSFSVNPFNAEGLGQEIDKSGTNGLSFLSYSLPGDGWSLAVYRHELLRFDSNYTQQPISIRNTGASLPTKTTEIDTQIVNYGLSGAWKVNDRLSLGLGLVYSLFDLESNTFRQGRNFQLQRGDDEDYTFNVGLLYQLSEQLQLGAAYRRGGQFNYLAGNFNVQAQPLIVVDTEFNVPNMFGVGLSWRPQENLAVGLDINWVEYSRLAEGYDDIFNAATTLEADDGVEIRLGAEYVFTQFAHPFSIRGGIWRDPDHALVALGPGNDEDVDVDRALFRPADDEMHYSLGLGWAFERVQFDLALDYSDNIRTVSASGVVRF